jgi:ribosomal-protein-alanine N-acetyltransferase
MVSPVKETQELNITRMTEHDLVDVVELEETCGLSRWGWEAYYAELKEEKRSVMLVARFQHGNEFSLDQKVEGFIAARLIADELHINNVAVREECRRLGIGGKLLGNALLEAGRMGAKTAFLEVRAGNVPAQALYARCGFRLAGRRPEYYTQPMEDALVMSLAMRRSA